MNYKDVIMVFEEAKKKDYFTDKYLLKKGAHTRDVLPICRECEYGVVRVMDDAVQLLIDRIHELEWGFATNAKE